MAVVGGGAYFDLPPGPELGRRNRRRAAKQEGWPAGALNACEKLEARWPGWYPNYRHSHQAYGADQPAGFYARNPNHQHMQGWVYGATAAKLAAVIESSATG